MDGETLLTVSSVKVMGGGTSRAKALGKKRRKVRVENNQEA